MLVTQIAETSSKARFRISIDGQFAFVLYSGELRQMHIEEGQELSEESYRHIMTQLLPRRAKLRSMNLLRSRDYTRKQLEDKLRQGGYPQSCVEEAVAYVEAYGYIDDKRYARDFIAYRLQSHSRLRIETDLLQKGVSKEVIREAFAELEDMGAAQDETAMILALTEKRGYHADTATVQEKQKMYGYLCRRGFSPEKIMKALSQGSPQDAP